VRGGPCRRQDAQASGGVNPREDRPCGRWTATSPRRGPDSAGGESLGAEAGLQSVRCAPAAPGGSDGERQAGAGPPRGGATPVGEKTSEGRNPVGASPVKKTDRASSGRKAPGGCESLKAQRRRERHPRQMIVAPACSMRRGERRPQGRSEGGRLCRPMSLASAGARAPQWSSTAWEGVHERVHRLHAHGESEKTLRRRSRRCRGQPRKGGPEPMRAYPTGRMRLRSRE
jgi:hypothetical protein